MEASQTPLRFGIMCNGATLQTFQAAAIRRLIETQTGVPIVLIVDDRLRPAESAQTRVLRRLTASKLLWRLYRGAAQPPIYRSQPVDEALAALPRINCRPQTKGRFSEYFSTEEISAISSYELDFILRFGFGIIRGEILAVPRYGVWSFHHGDERHYRGGPPAFWEIYEGSPVTGAILQRLTDRLDAGIILRRGCIKTFDYSYRHNFGRLLQETVGWPAAAAREILAGTLKPTEKNETVAPIKYAPTNLQMLRYFAVLGRNIARRLVERQTRDEWNIGAIRLTPRQAIQGAVARDVRWYPRFAGGWLADPISRLNGIAVDVLCERMRLDEGTAHISATTFDGNAWAQERKVIDTGCHASYPYVFSVDGETYCVPETQQSNDVVLYRATTFPGQWERSATLLDRVNVVDSTIFEHDGRWWLLCTDAEATGHRLLLFFAERFNGPWNPHPANPVKVDPKNSRPAGPPFIVDGALYRPAQDCSKNYGGRISINRIVELSTTRFQEESVSFVEPDPQNAYGKGLHTLSFAGDWAIIDGKRPRWKNSKK